MTLHISDEVKFVDELMLMSAMVLGMPESGKTSIAKVVCEEVWKIKQRFGVIDPKGDYYGLGSTADGQSAAIPVVVFGGEHAHVPLEASAGRFIANVVAKELQQPFIIDLEKLSKGRQISFVADFLEELYHINRDPLLLVIDEVERFAPEKSQFPEAHRCLGAVQDIFSLGRKHGIGRVGIAQRGAEANKTVIDKCDLGIFFRATGVLDHKRVRGWLEANMRKEDLETALDQLSDLETGQCIIASARKEIKVFKTVHVRRLETFDTGKTPGLKRRLRTPKVLATPDLALLEAKMHAQMEQQRANDPKALRLLVEDQKRTLRRQTEAISALETRLANAKAPREKIVRKEVKVPVLDKALLVRFAKRVGVEYEAHIEQAGVDSYKLIDDFVREWTPPPAEPYERAKIAEPVNQRERTTNVERVRPAERTIGQERAAVRESTIQSERNGEVKLPIAAQRILNAARFIEQQFHNESPDVAQLAVLARHTPGDSYWRAAVGRLRVTGLMVGTSLTDEGRALATAPDITSTEELHAFILNDTLKGQAFGRRMMEFLLNHPGEHSAEELADGISYAHDRIGNSYWRAALGRLRRLQLVSKSGPIAAAGYLYVNA